MVNCPGILSPGLRIHAQCIARKGHTSSAPPKGSVVVFDITDDIPGEGNAIVLGGGGASGMAWMIGVLAAWEEGGLKASSTDTAVGTSGGASVAVVLLQENGLREAFNKLLTPERQPFEVTAEISFDAFAESVGRISKQSAGRKSSWRACSISRAPARWSSSSGLGPSVNASRPTNGLMGI